MSEMKLGVYPRTKLWWALTIPDTAQDRAYWEGMGILYQWEQDDVPDSVQELMAAMQIAGDCVYGEYAGFGFAGSNPVYWLTQEGLARLEEGLRCDTESISRTAN